MTAAIPDFDHGRYAMSAERIVQLLRESLVGYDDSEINDAIDKINVWLARGDGVAIYENMDLGHRELGHRQFVSFGSAACTLEGPVPPEKLPDFPQRLNYRYFLVAIFRGESL